ncbi:MAG: S8 family peptidase [Lachnospiraceae bacterium]|nr:S8 family peptidase [Lachnospiraceae bacterium]
MTDLERRACKDRVLSNDYMDMLVDFNLPAEDILLLEGDNPDYCEHIVTEDIRIIYVAASMVPPSVLGGYRYQYLPKCYGLLQDVSALTEAGILPVMGPPLELTGRNVLVGIVDTGIRYGLPEFRRSDGSTRILSIWDQTNQQGNTPEGFVFGTEYTESEINANLESGEALLVTDENGHGTKVAGVIGGYDREGGYLGAAPGVTFVIVKLKQAKAYLRRFYQIPFDVPCYQETDIMMALQYLEQVAKKQNKPLVTCVALGTNLGAHDGSSLLNRYLDMLGSGRSRCMVVGGGNEGNAAGHYTGGLTRLNDSSVDVQVEEIELLVGQGEEGFWSELWGKAPGVYTVSIVSPSGETIPEIPYRLGQNQEYSFIYAATRIQIAYIPVELGSGQQLIAMRFRQPLPGIWKIRVYQQGDGEFHMWLPMRQFLKGDTYFLRPNPYSTLTEPAYGREVLAVSAYNSTDGSFYLNSGRGFATDGFIAPALAAPGVAIPTPLITETGSSVAAAMMAGAAACFMQWAVIEENDILVNTNSVKNYLIRGADRRTDLVYPSREWGYGTLNLEGVFEVLAGL